MNSISSLKTLYRIGGVDSDKQENTEGENSLIIYWEPSILFAASLDGFAFKNIKNE
jgi:hypothetical protein